MITQLTCGIVIYDEVSEIKNLLPKLIQELNPYSVEWVFVLNHEQGEIRNWISQWLRENIKTAICIENPSNNLGFARQLILEHATNEYIYLTDPDIDISLGNIRKLIQLANNEIINDSKSKIIGFGGTVTHKSNNYFIQSTFNFMQLITEIFPFAFQVQTHRHLVTVDHLPACHVLLIKHTSLNIGGFSSLHKKFGEDLDFTHRAFNNDYRFIFLPTAEVTHWQNLSLMKWFYKIFNLGRIQIPVQKANSKLGLRYYRLLPLLFLLTYLLICFFSFSFFIVSLIILSLVSVFNIGLLGFTLTLFTYSFGEFFECFLQAVESKNEEELKKLNLDLKNQYFLTNKDS